MRTIYKYDYCGAFYGVENNYPEQAGKKRFLSAPL
jgi:predicted adenine nucleotide alpha hydrolase (AANH) superfamily ATPase